MDVSFSKAASAYQNNTKMMEGLQSNPAEESNGNSFMEMVTDAIGKAVETGQKAEAMEMNSITGKADISELVTAVANAELTMNTVVAIRDRVISAYQEILRMPM